MKAAIIIVSAVLLLAPAHGLAAGPPSEPPKERYDPPQAGHPLRIAAYALHPVGVILDRLIFRPAWYIGSKEPIRTLVGRRPSRYELLKGSSD